jgi:hypothetical protein
MKICRKCTYFKSIFDGQGNSWVVNTVCLNIFIYMVWILRNYWCWTVRAKKNAVRCSAALNVSVCYCLPKKTSTWLK